jgi:hypothetical protein
MPAPTRTLAPTWTLTHTPTPTLSPASTSTPTVASWMNLRTECLEITSELPADFRGSGSIILWKMQGADHSYAVNMETGVRSILPDDWNWWEWAISPDEHWLTLQKDEDESTIQVLDPKGEVQATVHLEEDWGYSGWWDNERFEIYKLIDRDNKIYSLITLNPFTGNRQDFPAEYPDIYTLGAYFFPLAYDPALTRLIYPYHTKGEMGFRLRDVDGGQTLAVVPSIISLSSGPRWSPDGQQALVIGLPDFPNFGYFEFYTISRSGEVARLTDLGAYKAKISKNRFSSYSWSPDGRYIAFWITIDEDPVERLAVLDVSTHSVVNYCVPGLKPLGAYPPIWSSDSQQMVVYDPSLEGPVVVVDIKQKRAAAIGMYLEPEFWLRTVPDIWVKKNP